MKLVTNTNVINWLLYVCTCVAVKYVICSAFLVFINFITITPHHPVSTVLLSVPDYYFLITQILVILVYSR